jgi:hypothetical protein
MCGIPTGVVSWAAGEPGAEAPRPFAQPATRILTDDEAGRQESDAQHDIAAGGDLLRGEDALARSWAAGF